MKLRTLILIILCGILCFGGSFTCKSDNGSATFTS